MSDKPKPKDFMHEGVLMKPAYDSALKSWETANIVPVVADHLTEDQPALKAVIAPKLVTTPVSDVPEEPEIDPSTSTGVDPTEPLVFKVGSTITWKITPITKDGSPAKIQLRSLTVVSKPPAVEVSTTGENAFVLIPLEVGLSDLVISFMSVYGKLVTRTYKVTIVDGADEAVDMKVEYTIQG